jgi:hypothetical protein
MNLGLLDFSRFCGTAHGVVVALLFEKQTEQSSILSEPNFFSDSIVTTTTINDNIEAQPS